MSATAGGVPAHWHAAHVLSQLVVLCAAGAALLAASWQSPILEALIDAVTEPLTALAPPLALRILLPVLVPVALGIVLALTRHRAPLLLWIAVMAGLAALGVLEVARLNWAAFLSGVAFRIESGPVPILRSIGGLGVVLAGVLLMGHQSVHHHMGVLDERGIPRAELQAVRRRLLARERGTTGAAFAGGVLLLLVTRLSMDLTERAPRAEGSLFPEIIWVGLLLAALTIALAVALRRRGAA